MKKINLLKKLGLLEVTQEEKDRVFYRGNRKNPLFWVAYIVYMTAMFIPAVLIGTVFVVSISHCDFFEYFYTDEKIIIKPNPKRKWKKKKRSKN